MPEDVKKEAEEKGVEEEGEIEESPETSELIKKDISELAAILSENPGVEQQVREVIEYHLKESVDRTTLGKVAGGLEILLGEGAARITANSCGFNENKFFDVLRRREKEWQWIRHFLFYSTLLHCMVIRWKRLTISRVRFPKIGGVEMLICTAKKRRKYGLLM